MTLAIVLVDGDNSTGLLLDTLNDLAARANDCTDELLVDVEGNHAWSMLLEIGTSLRLCSKHALKDVMTTLLGLVESFFENLVRQTVALDIHLGGGDTLLGTCDLEVHIAEVIFIAQDVAQYGILR